MYNDFYQFMESEIKYLHELFLQKNVGQYAQNNDNPLINFEVGSLMKYQNANPHTMFEIAHDYMRKHLAYLEVSAVDSPKISESLTDIAVYCLILKYLIAKHEQFCQTDGVITEACKQ